MAKTHKHLRGPEIMVVALFRFKCSPILVHMYFMGIGKKDVTFSREKLNELDAEASYCRACNGRVNKMLADIRRIRKKIDRPE